MRLAKALKTRIDNFASPKLVPGGVHVGEWITSKTARSETYCTIIDRGTSRDRESGAMYWDEAGLSITAFAESRHKVRRLANVIEAVLDEADDFQTNEGGVVDIRTSPSKVMQEDDDTWRADIDLTVILEKLNLKALGTLHFHLAPEGLIYDKDGDPFVDWYDLAGSGATCTVTSGAPTVSDTAVNDLSGVQFAAGDRLTSPGITSPGNNCTVVLVHKIDAIASGTPNVFYSAGASGSFLSDLTSTSENHTITASNSVFESKVCTLAHGADTFGILIVENDGTDLRAWLRAGGSTVTDEASESYTPEAIYSAFELGATAGFAGVISEFAVFNGILGTMALANLKTHLMNKFNL